ncbi:MAG: ORF6N domain-containing protein [Planctomycetota bacterium]
MRLPQPAQSIERRIFLVRGRKVLLGGDLAALHGVAPKALVQALKRNRDRFPETSCSGSDGARSPHCDSFSPPRKSERVRVQGHEP